MKYLMLTFDVEEFVRPIEKNIEYNKDDLFEISKTGLIELLKLLNKHNIKSTFFITHEFSMRYKSLIKDLVVSGHELALHAYKHSDKYASYSDKKNYDLLKKAKQGLEREFKIEIKGFRSPQLQFINKEVLKDLNILYDSSFHPTYVPGNYCHLFNTRKPFIKQGVKIIPISVTALFRLPFSWIWFRNFGLTYAKICTKLALINSNYINLYFHPWDFADLSGYNKTLHPLYIRNAGKNFSIMMDRYISYCKKIGLKPCRMIDYVKNETI